MSSESSDDSCMDVEVLMQRKSTWAKSCYMRKKNCYTPENFPTLPSDEERNFTEFPSFDIPGEESSLPDFEYQYFENADKPLRRAFIVKCRKCKQPSSFFDASIYYPPNSEKTETDPEKKASVSDSNNSDLANKSMPEKSMSTAAILEEIFTDLINMEIPDKKEREYICKACKANKPPHNFIYDSDIFSDKISFVGDSTENLPLNDSLKNTLEFGGESSASLTSTDSSDTFVLFEDVNERKEQQSMEDSVFCEFLCGPTLGRQEEESEKKD
ncbi:hypothetical protein CDAR_464671 [Caerostris darwini]|uniref:Uncharacterized protein n=1 Tax=Caerostris darwini TaxID=1538125 RepID=A0AAV4Q9P7_9ARAC|nr:hypothetical protein CDAR_464671 [Caerostris darwini]